MKSSSKTTPESPFLTEALEQKTDLRTVLSQLPFKEKYKMIIAMQLRRAAILTAKDGDQIQRQVIWPSWED